MRFQEVVVNCKACAFGAVGNNNRDDTSAIGAAVTRATTLADAGYVPTLYFPLAIGYKVTSTITIPDGINVIMDGPIIYYGDTDEPALVIGTDDVQNTKPIFKLRVQRNTTSDWLSEDNIGIKLINPSSADITIVEAIGFTIGVQFMGSGNGATHNNVFLGRIIDNKVGLEITCQTYNSTIGWVTENVFIAGHFYVSSGSNDGTSRWGVRMSSVDDTWLYNDGNVFIKPSFQLQDSNASPGTAIPIRIEHGRQNEFHYCRNEGNNATFAQVLNASRLNYFHTLSNLSTANLDDTSTGKDSLIVQNRYFLHDFIAKPVVSISGLQNKACYYDGSTSINVAGMHHRNANDATITKYASGLSINSRYLSIDNSLKAIGFFFDTSLCKRFIITKEVETSYPGRIYVRCFDSSGTLLDSSGGNHPYVSGTSDRTLTYGAAFGNSYYETSANANPINLIFHADVAYAEILLGSANAVSCRVRGIQVLALERYQVSHWIGYSEPAPGCNLATTAPTTGTWEVGRTVYNAAPAAAGYRGWEVVTAGAPGTWKGFGAIEA